MPGNRKEPATIHDFAPETLSAVFSLVSLAAPPRRIYIKEGKTYVRPMYDLGWIPLAHVSRQWRGIALNTSFLWASTIPHLPRLEIYEILLARSRQTPLSIATIPDTYSDDEYNAAIYEYALERTNNVRSLSLHFGHRWSGRRQLDVQARAALCDNPLPRLTDLSLDVTLMGTEVNPETLLIDAPNLVSVSLRGIRCIFPAQNLLHLSYKIGVGQQGSAGNLLELLRHTPLLQTLRVSVDLVRPSDASPAYNTSLVHLSHLKLLCASLDQARDGDQIGDAEFFFKLLSFPPSCVVHLNDDVGRSLDDEGNKTFKICGDLFRRLPYDCVAFHAFNEWVRGFSVSAFFTQMPNPAPETLGDSLCVHHEFCGCTAPQTTIGPAHPNVRAQVVPLRALLKIGAADVLPMVIPHLQSDAITHVILDGMQELDVLAIREAFSSFTAVTTIAVRSRLNAVLRALSIPSEDESDAPFLPALRELTVTFSGIENHWEDMVAKWWRELCFALEQRKRIGLPVQKLHLVGSWSNKREVDWNKRFRPTPDSAYEEEVRRDAKFTLDADCDGLARARKLVEELIDERGLYKPAL